MKRYLFLFIILASLALSSCQASSAPEPNSQLREITLNLTYIPNVQFAPFYVAIEKGYFAEEGLRVTLNYGNEADLIALVGSGNQQFMVASGEQVLMARAQGLPVVAVFPWYKDYPVGVVSLKEKNIQTPQDLKGKVIGLPGLYGANYIGFEALANYAGLTDSDYTLASIGFTQVEAVVTQTVDAAVIYLPNEPSQLRAMGYEINLIAVSDYLDLVGNVLVTNEETIANEPELVSSVVRAFYRGVKAAAENPEEAYAICANFVENLSEADQAVQQSVLAESIKLWEIDPQPGTQQERWENMQEVLLQLGLMSQPIDVQGAYSDAFLP
jgi:NitT/TauT family transport system substrate-binding protein